MGWQRDTEYEQDCWDFVDDNGKIAAWIIECPKERATTWAWDLPWHFIDTERFVGTRKQAMEYVLAQLVIARMNT